MPNIELLGRCLECVIGKRSSKYCRVLKSHTQPKAAPCWKCYKEGNNNSKCRQELHHLDPNGTKTLLVYSILSGENTILSLPKSCQELESLGITVPVDDTTDLSSVKYATGYLLEYSATKFGEWYGKYCKQSDTKYSVHTGKQANTKSEHGTLHIDGKYEAYMVKWSKSYNCFRGGKGRLKAEIENPLKRRNAPGSRCCTCPAVIRTRLLVIGDDTEILEVNVPLSSAHENHTPTSITDQLCNKPLPEIENKIKSLVNDVRLTPITLKMAIQDWVRKELIPQHLNDGILERPPQPFNRSYFPTNKDLRNIAHEAILKRRCSLFDQEALVMLLKEQAQSNGLLYFFQKYSSKELKQENMQENKESMELEQENTESKEMEQENKEASVNSTDSNGQGLMDAIETAIKQLEKDSIFDSSRDFGTDQFLLVIQTPQQQKWLRTYGSIVTCMDAIYKTNRYAFPCFFLVVKTSIGKGRVVGTMIPQFETTELITRGLQIIKSWNPSWNPKFFMTDKSPAELEAIGTVLPSTIRFICDFHRSQAMDRWVNKGAHQVSPDQKHIVIDNFKKLAYITADHKFEETLDSIKKQPWFTSNKMLQEYLTKEWLSCKPLWSHVYRQKFHAEIDTDNLTEAFNNVLRSRYLRLRQDTSVFELVQILVSIVFPEQESDYIVAVAQQTEAYRKPRYNIPDFLVDRPQCVQAACLANISSAKEFSPADVIVEGDGKFYFSSKHQGTTNSRMLVNIPDGNCSCSYFCKTNIPCKHMFAVFNLFSTEWTWNNLPKHLTDSMYMTLETSVLDNSEVPSTSNGSNSQINGNCDECDLTTELHQEPPIPVTSAHKLRCLQKKAHEVLTKCRDVCYCCTDIKVLEDTLSHAEKIYSNIVVSADPNNTTEVLPSFPLLAKSSLNESSRSAKRLRRSKAKEKNVGPPPKCFKSSCDPLHSAKNREPGRPKNVRPRREKPKLPRQVSDNTREHAQRLKKKFQGSTLVCSSPKLSEQDNKENQCSNLSKLPIGMETETIMVSSRKRLKPSTSAQENGRKNKRCRCSGCSLPDCGQCKFCKDMVRFGGHGRKKQRCSQRKCISKASHECDKSTSSKSKVDHDERGPNGEEKPPIVGTAENQTVVHVKDFLSRSRRIVRSIARDGNCFFRTVSCHLLEDESGHYAVRSLLLRFENLNHTLFEKRLIPSINKLPIIEHINYLSRPGIWGTQVEIMALATLYQVPVYCCVTNSEGSSYHWEVTHPIATPDTLRYPLVTEEDSLFDVRPPSHFELLYWENLHFDFIQSIDASTPSVPDILSTHHFINID